MQIQIRTDSSITSNAHLDRRIRTVVQRVLSRFSHQVTSVVVHLRDENGSKVGADDKRCVIEARLAHGNPSASVQKAASVEQAVTGAARKLERSMTGTLARQNRFARIKHALTS